MWSNTGQNIDDKIAIYAETENQTTQESIGNTNNTEMTKFY